MREEERDERRGPSSPVPHRSESPQKINVVDTWCWAAPCLLSLSPEIAPTFPFRETLCHPLSPSGVGGAHLTPPAQSQERKCLPELANEGFRGDPMISLAKCEPISGFLGGTKEKDIFFHYGT